MLIYSMSVSVDAFIANRDGAFEWGDVSDEQFRFHLEQVRELGSCLLGRRLYETMLVWETDPSLRDNELGAAFADVCARSRRSSSAVRSTAFRATPGSPGRRWSRRSLRRSGSDSSTSCACSAIRSLSVAARRSCRGHRRRPARPDRDQDVRLPGDL